MRILAVIHAPFETPGTFKTWAENKGYDFNEVHVYRDETLPSADEYDFYLFMGGPQTPNQTRQFPYLKDEIELAHEAIKKNKFVVGVCLGAQIMGEALGSPVQQSPEKEVGVFPISLTTEGQGDPLLEGLPFTFPVAHWHNDMPGLTQHATVLARSEGCPRQIVRYGEKAVGFQCHFEMTREMAVSMIEHCPEDLIPRKYVQSAEELIAEDFQAFNTMLVMILNKLTSQYSQDIVNA